MLRHTIALASSLVSLALVLSPTAGAQGVPCEQPAFGLFHADAAQAGLLGAGGHVPGQEHLGFSSCLR